MSPDGFYLHCRFPAGCSGCPVSLSGHPIPEPTYFCAVDGTATVFEISQGAAIIYSQVPATLTASKAQGSEPARETRIGSQIEHAAFEELTSSVDYPKQEAGGYIITLPAV
ncbi:MAG: hypothetical protein EHM18_13300 [Acidobacteria bacterium]|nr:MAG: hypothetical protein EHM18_14935 [Acidobacteriota bacterium]RPJ83734.1 MAG: hypothetical protein EHM18_13300 [Acidobacteriota bacterium]